MHRGLDLDSLLEDAHRNGTLSLPALRARALEAPALRQAQEGPQEDLRTSGLGQDPGRIGSEQSTSLYSKVAQR